ncbi:MAG: glycoside hydrolase family 127 protein, partial [Phycisphaerae bacterium]|nr:glycoside hydrolase family 127 protein [Phycisphaerae bacterium]
MPAPKRKLKSFDLGKVKIDGGFWKPRLNAAATGGLMDIYSKLQQTGRLDALKLTWKRGRANKPQPSWDCDVAKWLEAACCVLQQRKAPKLETLVGKVAKLLAGAQQKDGYVNSYITTVTPTKRWKDLAGGYELDFAATFISAAVTHYETTDSKTLLKAAEKFADHLASVFDGEKKLKGGYPGAAAIELALIKLARATKKDTYTALAARFIELRGQAFGSVYKRTELYGSTTTVTNFLPGAVDIATETGDAELLGACNAIWKDLTLQKMYITGGAGCLSN